MQRKSESITCELSSDLPARTEASSALAELEQRFALFRSQHSRGTRVPEELRAAVFNALSAGVKVTALRRGCGLAGSQVAGWQSSRKRVPVSGRGEPTEVRAFSVVDGEPPTNAAPEMVPGQPLELRFGPWSVSVRQTPAGRG